MYLYLEWTITEDGEYLIFVDDSSDTGIVLNIPVEIVRTEEGDTITLTLKFSLSFGELGTVTLTVDGQTVTRSES